MNVKVSRSALENTIKMLMEADPPPTPPSTPSASPETPMTTPAAATTATAPPGPAQEPERELDNSAKIARKVKELEDSKAPTLSVGDRTFIKQGKKFFIKDIQISTEDLLNLVKNDVRERLQKEIDKGAQSIGIRGDEFIEPVSRGASFSTEGRGTWVDLAEVPVDIVAEYILRAEGDISDTAAYVSGEVTESAGKHLVYRTTELSIVIPEGSKDVYIMSTQNDPTDPLGSALQLLKSANILAEWRANPIRFYELVGLGPAPGRNFAFQIDEKMKLGGFNKALKAIRTTAGKFFDFLNPFEGANIEVNFKFTEFGPALVRANVFGGTGFRIQAGGLTDTDLARLSGTDYFRFESLDRPVDAEYQFKEGKEAPPDPYNAKPKSGTYEAYSPDIRSLTINNEGLVSDKYSRGNNPGMLSDYGFGRALWIYLKGYLEEKKAPVEAAPEPVAPPTPPEKDPMDEVLARVGTPLGDQNGAVFFKFDSDQLDVEEPENYIDSVITDLVSIIEKIPPAKRTDVERYARFYVSLITTSDPIGEPSYNRSLADKRAKVIRSKIDDALKAKNLSGIVGSYLITVGEDPWKTKEEQYKKLGKGQAANDNRKWLRFCKAYFDTAAGPKTITTAAATTLATEFGDAKLKQKGVTLPEAKQETHIRQQVRLLVRESLNKKNTR